MTVCSLSLRVFFFESYQDVILYLNGLLVIWVVKLYMSGRDLKSTNSSRTVLLLGSMFICMTWALAIVITCHEME